jgi:hypothetical protein
LQLPQFSGSVFVLTHLSWHTVSVAETAVVLLNRLGVVLGSVVSGDCPIVKIGAFDAFAEILGACWVPGVADGHHAAEEFRVAAVEGGEQSAKGACC